MSRSVSVIIPVWNEPDYRLQRTIQSAILALPDEIIVVDDGSAQPIHLAPSPLIKQYRLEENLGIPSALNYGAEKSTGELLCWLSVGDTFYAHKIALQQGAMEANGARASFHDYMCESAGGTVVRPHVGWQKSLYTDNVFSGSTTMVERELFAFDPELHYCQDWNWACSVQHLEGWHHIPEVLGTSNAWPNGHSARATNSETLNKQRQRERASVAKRWMSARKTG